jgi:ribosomal protein L34E
MKTICFVPELQEKTLKIIYEAHDCTEIAKDLYRINYINNFGSDEQARQLDNELRKKYPTISIMLNVGDSLQVVYQRPLNVYSASSFEKARLKQDYWGILCDTAIKKGIKNSIESCIDHIEE